VRKESSINEIDTVRAGQAGVEHMTTKKSKSTAKSSVRRRSRLVTGGQAGSETIPGGQQDAKRRMGTFETAGEHARVGGRTSGIVGQTKQRFRTDLKSKSK
jgi:hypothetical protein